MMPFRKIIYMAVNNGLLQRDPFFAYSITKEETKRGFLTQEEIRLLINGAFKKPSYTLIRDLFIFCTFTGLSWTDMANLTKANLRTSFDGHLWIDTNRQKTGVETNILFFLRERREICQNFLRKRRERDLVCSRYGLQIAHRQQGTDKRAQPIQLFHLKSGHLHGFRICVRVFLTKKLQLCLHEG